MIKNEEINVDRSSLVAAEGLCVWYIKIKLEAKYFIIISAGFIDRRELLQITSSLALLCLLLLVLLLFRALFLCVCVCVCLCVFVSE